jgi:tRNA G18 (ribose-2'-O)-methylase SpoU
LAVQLNKDSLRENKLCRDDFKQIGRSNIYIVLDSLKCAHNIGAILRLSDALLIKKVFICGDTIIPPNKKIKSGSIGAEKWVDWEYHKDAAEVVRCLKKQDVTIISAEITDDSIEYTEYAPESPVCLILGREYDGVSQELLELSDYNLHLPILGMCNSINVSTAASVLMYYLYDKLTVKSWETKFPSCPLKGVL